MAQRTIMSKKVYKAIDDDLDTMVSDSEKEHVMTLLQQLFRFKPDGKTYPNLSKRAYYETMHNVTANARVIMSKKIYASLKTELDHLPNAEVILSIIRQHFRFDPEAKYYSPETKRRTYAHIERTRAMKSI